MPFGLCNAPATFKRLMERVLAHVPRQHCIVSLNDLLIHASDFEGALCNLREVFAAIRQTGLRLNPKKCQLFRRKTAFLGHVVKELPTYKDVDFRNNMQKVYVNEEEKDRIMEKLNRDVEFLVQLRIMDYSLLLGIHDVERAEREEEELEESSFEEEAEPENGLAAGPAVGSYGTSPDGIAGYLNSYRPLGPGEFEPYVDMYVVKSAAGAPQREVYFIGLIDVLTQYDTKKKEAHAAKTVKHGAGAEISTVHPEQYAKRFRDFIATIFA
ncbi:hypothetical protein AAFF_G00367680 [Aldrovandia affinis]|uniref:Phosphatidylinositol 5-phosphate 4-kinase type-2 gamma n=1 Tax=Aldrovandia affinis TaxID=143900 RepID=A0AAD7R528_9TELE|nr:hypothetical protein AAFF_G00367680 [Aldrovandia affinis]